MVISRQLAFVFLGIPRTANRAMHAALLKLPGAVREGLLHEMDIPDECRPFFTFCSVRNPYRRCLAYYRWRAEPHPWGSDAAGLTFDQYIDQLAAGELGPATVRGHVQSNRLDAVIRYEDLPDSFYALAEHIPGLERVELGAAGKRLSRHWKLFYDEARARRVYELTRADFDEFGYDPDSWRKDYPE